MIGLNIYRHSSDDHKKVPARARGGIVPVPRDRPVAPPAPGPAGMPGTTLAFIDRF
jgi:hypothetical protein